MQQPLQLRPIMLLLIIRMTARKQHAALNLAMNPTTASHLSAIMAVRTTARKWHTACQYTTTLATLSHHTVIMDVRNDCKKVGCNNPCKTPCNYIPPCCSYGCKPAAFKDIKDDCKNLSPCENKMIGRIPVVKLDSEGPCLSSCPCN